MGDLMLLAILGLIGLAWLCYVGEAFIYILRRDFPGGADKVIWLVIIWTMPLIGAFLYNRIGRKD